MLQVRTIHIDKQCKQLTQGPHMLVVVNGSGCGMPRCGCSSANFIIVSDGDTALSVALTKGQADAIRATGRLDTSYEAT